MFFILLFREILCNYIDLAFLDLPIIFDDYVENQPVPVVKKTRNRYGINLDPSLLEQKRERRACAPDRCKFVYLFLLIW